MLTTCVILTLLNEKISHIVWNKIKQWKMQICLKLGIKQHTNYYIRANCKYNYFLNE